MLSARFSIAAALLCMVVLGGCGGQDAAQTNAPPPADKQIANRAEEDPPAKPEEQSVVEDLSQQIPLEPAPVYRPDDDRAQHDDKALAAIGIHLYESKRLKLYTDIDPEIARTLPAIMDQAYDAWVDYFGPLPGNHAGTEYQMTGYIMADRRLFLETGLLPENLVDFMHGRHRGAEFWMNDQEHDYYRRHLMIHEGTHCYMTTMPVIMPPPWYMEGMAELFGTHRIDPQGRATFRAMPQSSLDVRGWGRVQIIEEERGAGRMLPVKDILSFTHKAFLKVEAYAWSWTLCKYLDAHPRYRQRFRELGGHLESNAFAREFRNSFFESRRELEAEWVLFIAGFEYGYDFQRSVVDLRQGKLLDVGEKLLCEVTAERGWQSSGVDVQKGETYELTAEGRVVLAKDPKPWIADANGVTIRYHAGHPLGILTATVLPADNPMASALTVQAIGRGSTFIAPHDGTLYLRVNDDWGELADNSGAIHVRIAHVRLESP